VQGPEWSTPFAFIHSFIRTFIYRAYQNHFPEIWPLRVNTEIPIWRIPTPGRRVVLEKLTMTQINTKLAGSVDDDKCFSLAIILSQISPVHFITPHFPKIHINVILPLMAGSFKSSTLFRLWNKNFVSLSYFACLCYMPC
jgi:hypothetical protein